MGYTEFLVGQNIPAPSSLPKAIEDLEDTSTVFMNRWRKGEFQRAGDVSKGAMVLLDFIANEFLREKVKRKGLGTYLNSKFASQMSIPCGIGVTGASLADQQKMVQAGPGKGQLPTNLGTPKTLEFSQLLNKVKHRSPYLMNFRIDNDQHIFVICPEDTGGGAEGIYEFDLEEFCGRCRLAADAL
jgi:hypothetical protein